MTEWVVIEGVRHRRSAMASPMPDVSDEQWKMVSLGMAIEALREHHASLGPVEGHAAQTAQLIEDVHWNFLQVNDPEAGE